MFSHVITRCVCYFGLILLVGISPSIVYSAESKPIENLESTKNTSEAAASTTTSNMPTSSNKADAATLPEVKVSGNRIKEKRIDKTQSITTVTSEELERTQPSTIFDALRDVPGLSIDGGPRLTGMSFNIRGFSDNEDVAVKVDGVQKNFEKYRMSGTFIEPELLKTIEVQRGPQIASGSGSLGGTILATTKDASDLLAPGQRYGAKAKFGYGSNNDEYSKSYIVYARPLDQIDILYNYTNRQSNNIMQGDGQPLPYSAAQSVSHLLKFSVFPTDSLQLTTSVVKYDQGKTVQLYDSISEFNTQFGYVLRAIDELTISETVTFKPDSRWVDFKATVGKGHTNNDETTPFGWPRNTLSATQATTYYCDGFIRRRISNNAASTPLASATNCRGDRYELYAFENTTVDIANTSKIYQGESLNITVLGGIQYLKQDRSVALNFENPASLAVYGGYIPVSGKKTTYAGYIQPRLEWEKWSITPGIREDRVVLEAKDDTLRGLEDADQPSRIHLNERTYSLGVAYDVIPKRLSLFTNYGQAFRPASMEYQYFPNNGRISGIPISTSPCPDDGSSCDDIYKAQRSENTEVGISYINPNLFDQQIQLISKATFFHIHTSNLINSWQDNNGVISQNGKETRNGWEFENSLIYKYLYGRVNYSRIAGTVTMPTQEFPVYTIPGHTLNLSLGVRMGEQWDANISYRKVGERQYLASLPPTYSFATQDNYEIFNAAIRWAPNKHLAFRVVGENLGNTLYYLDGGFAGTLGLVGAGRNIKFVTELTY
jgi:hemoglobin/transferrin/lactoferrin receptor protein